MNKARKLFDLLKFLHLQRVRGFPPPGDEPFMDQTGAERFREEASRARSYVKFGSGGSAVFIDRLGIPAISVENDPAFAAVSTMSGSCAGGRSTWSMTWMTPLVASTSAVITVGAATPALSASSPTGSGRSAAAAYDGRR